LYYFVIIVLFCTYLKVFFFEKNKFYFVSCVEGFLVGTVMQQTGNRHFISLDSCILYIDNFQYSLEKRNNIYLQQDIGNVLYIHTVFTFLSTCNGMKPYFSVGRYFRACKTAFFFGCIKLRQCFIQVFCVFLKMSHSIFLWYCTVDTGLQFGNPWKGYNTLFWKMYSTS
jgi:hypothetical protein